MGDLKTCPFCGGKAFWRGAGGWCGIGCLTDKCPAYMHALMFRESADAEAVWNRRASNERNAQLQDHITHAIGLLRGAYRARVDVAWPTVDEFAQQVRWLNGSNKMGAGTLAEKLLEWLQSRIAGVPEAQRRPLFAVGVARRKWECLQADGYRMQRIHFARSIDGHERRGSIDPWGKVLWEPGGVAPSFSPSAGEPSQ